MKGMDIEGVNKKLSSICGESIDVGISYDKSMKPTLIESIKKDIPDIWKKVQAIERGEPLQESTEITEDTVDAKTAIKYLNKLFRGRTAGIDYRVLMNNIKNNPEGKFRLLRKGDQTIVVDDNDKEMGSWSDLDNDVRNAVVGKGFDHKEQEMGNWSNFNDAFTEFLKNSK